jgi:YD repeat-containing protein
MASFLLIISGWHAANRTGGFMTTVRCKGGVGKTALSRGLLLSTILISGFASSAQAQQAALLPPPVFDNVDENGVDLATGNFEFSAPVISIGPEDGGLSYNASTTNGIWRSDGNLGFVRADYGSPLITVTLNGDSETFTITGWPGGTITSNQNEGSTLTFVKTAQYNGIYTYTKSDGTIAKFDVTKYPNGIGNGSAVSAMLTSIMRPNGTKTEVEHQVVTASAGTPTGTLTGVVLSGVKSIQNNRGYQLKLSLAGSGTQITAVTAINNVDDFCSPSASTCTLTQPAAVTTVDAGIAGGNYNTFNSITDALGRKTSFTYAYLTGGPRLTGIMRPGSTTNNITVAYDANNRVSSLIKEGVTYGYSFVLAGGVMTATRTNPLGKTFVTSIPESVGQPSSIKDESNRTRSYQYDASGRTIRITEPEGNYTQYAYDARGNLLSSTRIAKAGSGLANIVASASYPATCLNSKSCNKPVTSTDPKGNVTDYTYDPGSGFVTSIKSPADSSGVRPETRFPIARHRHIIKIAAARSWHLGSRLRLQILSRDASLQHPALARLMKPRQLFLMVRKQRALPIICFPFQ